MNLPNDYTLEFTLRQHTPMIHFQHDQPGATLRATELKPKLDRFMLQEIYKNDFDSYKKYLIGYNKEKKKRDFDKKFALDYKINIFSKLSSKKIPSKYLYFANNSIKDKSKQRKMLEFKGNTIKIVIRSFHTELLRDIEKHLPLFFLTHNFGTRQSKGYGSFFPENSDPTKTIRMLGQPTYKITYNNGSWEERVDYVHKLIKSGINFREYKKSILFEYMCEPPRKIRWEKRRIKQEYRKTVVRPFHKQPVDCKQKLPDDRFRFVRALLGLATQQEYNRGPKSGGELITVSNENIKRFKSPILYKKIGKTIYILPNRSYNTILNKSFTFSIDKNSKKNKPFELMTPEEFDIFDFFDYVCRHPEGKKVIEKVHT